MTHDPGTAQAGAGQRPLPPLQPAVAWDRAAVAVLAVLYLVQVLRLVHVNVDDAYMVFRYAVNLARGLGFTFDGVERVEGFSCFGYVVLLSGLFKLAGLAGEVAQPATVGWMMLASRAVGAAFAVLASLELAALLRAAFGFAARHCCLALLPLSLCADFTFSSTNGMETGFVLFLYAAMASRLLRASLGERVRRNFLLGVAFGGLLILARADGFFLAAVFAASWLVTPVLFGRLTVRQSLRPALLLGAPLAAVLAGYLAFRYAYFGEWMPNTYFVKFPTFSLNTPIEVRDFWNTSPMRILAWRRLPLVMERWLIPATWGYAVASCYLLAFAYSARNHQPLAPLFRHLREPAAGGGASRLELFATAGFAALACTLYLTHTGGDWMPGHRPLMHFLPVTAALVGGLAVEHVRFQRTVLGRWAAVPAALLLAVAGGNAYTAEFWNDHLRFQGIAEHGRDEAFTDSPHFAVFKDERPFPERFLQYAAFIEEVRARLSPGDTVAVYESGYASMRLGEEFRILDLSGLNDPRLSRGQPGDVFYAEGMVRTYYTCGGTEGPKDAFVLSREPRLLVFDTFQLRWCRQFPETLYGGRYRLLRGFQHNRLGFFSVYERATGSAQGT